MKTETNIFSKPFIELIATGVIESIQKEFFLDSNQKEKTIDTRFLSPTEFSKKFGISKPIIYKLIKNGSLPFYQLKGSSKKYLKAEDIDKVMNQVLIPP